MIKDILKTLRQNYWEFKRKPFHNKNINDKYEKIIKDLNKKGYYVIKNYLSKKKCKEIINDIDKMIINEKNFLWSDKENSDFRLHGSQNRSRLINDFNKDSFINKISDTFLEYESYSFSTLAAKLISKKKNLGSGGGWHRDTALESRQFKAILYLTDVQEDNGPFQYVNGSNNKKSLLRNIWLNNIKYGQNRFTDKEINKVLIDKYFTDKIFTGSAGTLLLVNTFGLHRGMPIKNNFRYALTNYYYSKDSNIDYLNNKFNPITS